MSETLVAVLSSFLSRARRWPSKLWTLEARLRGIEVGNGVEFLGRSIMTRHPGSVFVLGAGGTYGSSVRCNPLGNAQPCVLRTMAGGARLEIGERVGMSSTTVCAAASVSIGEGTICGAGAMIIDNDFHTPTAPWDWAIGYKATARPVRIGRGCFIGARAIVLKGVTIGDRAVIGAGAVVTQDVPAGAVVAGNPARIVRQPHATLPSQE